MRKDAVLCRNYLSSGSIKNNFKRNITVSLVPRPDHNQSPSAFFSMRVICSAPPTPPPHPWHTPVESLKPAMHQCNKLTCLGIYIYLFTSREEWAGPVSICEATGVMDLSLRIRTHNLLGRAWIPNLLRCTEPLSRQGQASPFPKDFKLGIKTVSNEGAFLRAVTWALLKLKAASLRIIREIKAGRSPLRHKMQTRAATASVASWSRAACWVIRFFSDTSLSVGRTGTEELPPELPHTPACPCQSSSVSMLHLLLPVPHSEQTKHRP